MATNEAAVVTEDPPVEGQTVNGKRERKKPTFFSAEATPATPNKKDVVGTGTPLVENVEFCRGLDKYKGDDELIHHIHLLFYGTKG